MPAAFGVDPDRLGVAGGFLQQAAAELRTDELRPLRTAYEGLLARWRGPDQARFREAFDGVLEVADRAVEVLEAAGLLLVAAASTYDGGQHRQAAVLDQVGGRLRDGAGSSG